MGSRTSELILKATDQWSDTLKKTQAQFAATKIAADDLNKSVQKLQNLHPGLSQDEAQAAAEALNRMKSASDATGKGFANASIAARGLSQELGINLPRVVSSFLAQSKTIGPALSTAFSVVAVIGMAEVLSRIPALFESLKGAVTGWNETSKKAYDDFIKANIEAGNHAEELKEKINSSTAGRTEGSVAKAAAEYKAVIDNIGLASERSKELLQIQQKQSLAIADQNTIAHNIGQYIPFLRLYWAEADEKVEQYKKTLPEIIQLSDQYAKKIQEQNTQLKLQADHQLKVAENARLLTTRGIADQNSASRRRDLSAGIGLDTQTDFLRNNLAIAGQEGSEQDPFRAIARQETEAENRRSLDRIAELNAQRKTAANNIDPEKRQDDLARIDADLEAEARRHQNEVQSIENKSLSSQLSARERFYATLREMQVANSEFTKRETEEDAREEYESQLNGIRNIQSVQEAQARALLSQSKREPTLLGTGSLDAQKQQIDQEYKIRVTTIDKEIDAVQALQKTYEDLGKAKEAAGLQNELNTLAANRQIAAIDRTSAIRQANDEFIKSFRDGIGRVWDDFRQKGVGAFADLANYIAKRFTEGLLTSLLFGSRGGAGIAASLGSIGVGGGSGGGLLGGLIGKLGINNGPWSEAVPGASQGGGGIFGNLFGGGLGGLFTNNGIAANAAGGTLGLGVPGAGPGISGGISGALGLNGGAGLLGLGAATLPIVATVGGMLAIAIASFFGNHRNAPFTRDPNEIQKTREYEFYSSVADLAQAAKDISNFGRTLNSLPPGVVVTKGLPVALNSSNQFRRQVNATLQQDF